MSDEPAHDRTETLDRSVASLNLSVRASNALEAADVATLRDLVQRSEQVLLRLRSFGRTSLTEVNAKLRTLGLRLGMSARDVARWERFGE